MQILDPIGASFSLLSTYLFTRASNLAWPAGLLACMTNFFLHFRLGIYGDMSLELIYFGLMIYGWYYWRSSETSDTDFEVETLTRQQAITVGLIASVAIPSLSYVLQHYAHSTVPKLDAITTVVSLLAQWLLCRKVIENWLLWLFVDMLYIGLYLVKGIPYHAMTAAIYCGMVLMGYFHWKSKLPKLVQEPL